MRIFGAIAISLVASAAFSTVQAETSAAPREFSRTVNSNVESQIASATFWTSDCAARPVTVTIKKGPSNGTVSIRDGLNQVKENPRFGTAGRCVGRQVMGKQIVYRSKAGFRGADVIIYETVSDRGERATTTINVEVK